MSQESVLRLHHYFLLLSFGIGAMLLYLEGIVSQLHRLIEGSTAAHALPYYERDRMLLIRNSSLTFELRSENYCIAKNVQELFPEFDEEEWGVAAGEMTFATHGSLSYMADFRSHVRTWDGPVSLGVFVPGKKQVYKALLALRLAYKCEKLAKEKVSSHLLFPLPSNTQVRCHDIKLSRYLTPTVPSCERLSQFVAEFKESAKYAGLSYPFNAMRNLAKTNAKTHLVLLADSELMPNPGFAKKFQEFFNTFPRRFALDKEVFVTPVFEIDESVPSAPETVDELADLFLKNLSVSFHGYTGAAHCHKMPDMQKWWREETVEILRTTKFVRPCWEPVYISVPTTPPYAENFVGFGYNKMQQAYELCRARYDFHIMTGLFLIHRGIKRVSIETKQRLKVNNQNARLFRRFEKLMDRKYGKSTRVGCSGPLWIKKNTTNKVP